MAGSGGTGGCPEGSTGDDCESCVVYVDHAGGSDGNSGRSWALAKATIQAGIEAAFADAGQCDVWVAEGTYFPTYKADPFSAARYATLQMREGIAVYGGFAGGETAPSARDLEANPTIISGEIGAETNTDNLYHVVTSADGALLDGVTITRGYDTRGGVNGAGLRCEAGTFTVSRVTFTDNVAREGAAIGVLDDCDLFVDDSTFVDNRVVVPDTLVTPRGGAIRVDSGALTVQNSRFSNNSAQEGQGGAIYSTGPGHIRHTRFEGNRVTGAGAGGAVYASDPLVLEHCTFADNQVGNGSSTSAGGAIRASDELVVRDSVFTGNKVTSFEARGGAIFASAALEIEGGTFTGNTIDGGGVAHGGALQAGGVTTIVRTRFTENQVTAGGSTIRGGAVFFETGADVALVNATFEGNAAVGPSASHYGNGGAVFSSGELQAANCLFIANEAGDHGGAIYNNTTTSNGAVLVANSTFYGNHAQDNGGAVYNRYSTSTFVNDIFWGNTAGVEGHVIFNYATSTTTVRYSNVQGTGFNGTDGNIDADPLFVSTLREALDLRLRSGSPSIGTGSNAELPADAADLDADEDIGEALPLDLDDHARVQGGVVDMGAYEAAP